MNKIINKNELIDNIINQTKILSDNYKSILKHYDNFKKTYKSNNWNDHIKEYFYFYNLKNLEVMMFLSSINFNNKDIIIKTNINNIKIFKNRYDSLNNFINEINLLKKEIKLLNEIKKRHNNDILSMVDEDINSSDLINCIDKDYESFINNFKKLLLKHGLIQVNYLTQKLINIYYDVDNTSNNGLKDFLNILKPQKRIFLKNADLEKDFCVTLSFYSSKKEHQEIYDNKLIQLKNNKNDEYIEKLIKPLQFVKKYYISFDINSNDSLQKLKEEVNNAFEEYNKKLNNYEKKGYFGEYFLTIEEKIKDRQEYIKNYIKCQLEEICFRPENMNYLWEKPKWCKK